MQPSTNELIKETSPYLLQHAYNPVNWLPWSEAAFKKAEKEDKLVLISIGYSACHWCHVMEHESFEDEEVATWMNRYFICIKVDREERPDVDQVYMTAVQLMTRQGGWPLNCFTLPNGKPIYGGTYFPKEQWIEVLKSLQQTYQNKKKDVLAYAEKLTQGIQQHEIVTIKKHDQDFNPSKLKELVSKWKNNFDHKNGGSNHAPKFPLPNNYEFLLRYAIQTKDNELLNHVFLTLDKMAFGGIFDQIGGGFCRYSVDVLWKVPHFEKMLYDNAQLVSLYSKAYQYSKNETYKQVVIQTLNWVKNEMTTSEGAFYSALDADSEGKEGKFYVWTKKELEELLKEDYPLIENYYNINQSTYWEEENHILMRSEHHISFAEKHNIPLNEFEIKIAKINDKIRIRRASRVRPNLDNKCLTSWNAMQLKAHIDAYFAFNEEKYLLIALKNAEWIVKNQFRENGELFHNFNAGKSTINGFLEDYAHVISSFVHLYQATFDEKWLNQAKKLTEITINNFLDEKSSLFYFTDKNSDLIARKIEIHDNVISSTNSIMCMNLFLLGTYFQKESYIKQAKQMLTNVYENMQNYGSAYSNWAFCLMNFTFPFYEVCITGNHWKENLLKINQNYIQNASFSGGTKSNLPNLKGKDLSKNLFFKCSNKTCSLPISSIEEFLETL